MTSSLDRKGYALIAAVALTLTTILVGVAISPKEGKPGFDNCVGDAIAATVVVIDVSESLSEQTRAEISARALKYIKESVQVNERVSIFTIDELSKSNLKPLLSICRPPSEGSRVTQNVKMIAKRFDERFMKPLEGALKVDPSGSKESPIAQAITDISLSSYMHKERNTLLVFSDMLENTPSFSLYKCSDSAGVIDRYRRSRAGAQERPKFTNTNVVFNIIPRADVGASSLKCRDKLWSWFVGDNAGPDAKVLFEYLPGRQ